MAILEPFLLRKYYLGQYRTQLSVEKGLSGEDASNLEGVILDYNPDSFVNQFMIGNRLKKIKQQTTNQDVMDTIDENIRYVQQQKKPRRLLNNLGYLTQELLIACVHTILPPDNEPKY